MLYERDTFKQIVESRTILVYGASVVATQVGMCLMDDPYNVRIAAFVVTNASGNPKVLLKRPVITIDVAEQVFPKDTMIIVACVEKNRESIGKILAETPFSNIIYLTFESDLWAGIRGNYMRSRLDKLGYRYRVLQDELREIDGLYESKSMDVYRAVSKYDKTLSEDISNYDWEQEIFVGAAFADECGCKLRDDVGDNISNENKKYCELTALYWLWKNADSDYVGLCHYRRHFCLTEQERRQILNSNIDVVVTVPVMNYPSVLEIYERDHDPMDWKIMKKGIMVLYPDYLFDLIKVERGNFYFGYNMFIAKKEIFKKYCKWLFEILDFCNKYCEPKDDEYQNRFLGFLGERLLTVYMLHHYDEFRIAIADKHFVE
ncbi:MAG: DUF4422 domain-containing protein [Pseudobutyrivibrio sp.]|nr:DUF4422 domain-containing protein [Pseudobutyrivibrio sp.]